MVEAHSCVSPGNAIPGGGERGLVSIAIPWALVGELAASEVRDPSPDVMPDSSPATIPPGIMVGSLARLSTVRHHAMPAKASGWAQRGGGG